MTISSTGLISGLNTKELVEALIKVDQEQVTLLEDRQTTLEDEQEAFESVLTYCSSLMSTLTSLKTGVTFHSKTTQSSDENVLTATANSDAAAGTYTFTVLQEATAEQLVSSGYSNSTSSIGTGSITIETGNCKLNSSMALSDLLGQDGITKGTISITDCSGKSASIDIRTCVTVDDFLEAINDANVDVTASLDGDKIVMTDTTGSTTSKLKISGTAAEEMGLAGSYDSTGGTVTVTSDDLVYVSESTLLSSLNDGNGVATDGTFGSNDLVVTLSDGSTVNVDLDGITSSSSLSMLNSGEGVRAGAFEITNAAGNVATISLNGTETIDDVLTKVNNCGLNLTAKWGGTGFSITDGSTGDKKLTITDVNKGSTAADLGITSINSSTPKGSKVYSVSTIKDVITAIQTASSGKINVAVSTDGTGLVLTDNTGGSGSITIGSGSSGSTVAEDLGLAGTYSGTSVTGTQLLAGLDTVLLRSLNGGSGVTTGTISITNTNGNSADLDLSKAQTLKEVLDAINNSGLGVTAAINDSGTGITLTDTNGGTSNFVVSGTMAESLNIDTNSTTTTVDSGNLQKQYVSRATSLSDLNGGEGITAGSFMITNSNGNEYTIKLTSSDVESMTVGDLIDKINSSTTGIKASINETGDGILITDTAGGSSTLTIENSGTSTIASDLNIAGTAGTSGSGSIDGSYEHTIDLGGSDTLTTLVEKINALDSGYTASIINDGSSKGYRLSLTSTTTGSAGDMTITTSGDISMKFTTLTQAQDAVVAVGGTSSSVISVSSSNTFTNLVTGLTLNVAGADPDSSVKVTVSVDTDKVVEKLTSFVESYNTLLSAIGELTAYDADTQEKGTLMGDNTILSLENMIEKMVTNKINGLGGISRLSDIGLSFNDDGALELDKDAFLKMMKSNGDDIESFFTTTDTGWANQFKDYLDRITASGGTLDNKIDGYDDRIDLLDTRIENLEALLDSKEDRLYEQFSNMETALSSLSSTQSIIDSWADSLTSSSDDD
jgi:flagellar hook-associated protein 2